MRDQAHEKMKNLTLSAMFAAVIMLMILYLFHIPVGSSGGYVHFGDAFIYLAACFLPMPYACGAAAIGAGLADVLSGSAIWAIPTMIIKPLTALWFTNKQEKLFNRHNLIGVLIANSRSQAVTDTKLEELTREVREHNNFARRVPILEEQMKVANHRIADLEQNEKVRN